MFWNSIDARACKATMAKLKAMKAADQNPDTDPPLCMLCLGDGVMGGHLCPRCKGTGLDPDRDAPRDVAPLPVERVA